MTPWDLYNRGLQVIPVPRASRRYDGKTPTIFWKRLQTERVTKPEMRRWFNPTWPVNIAILTGQLSGVVVVDIDDEKALGWAKANLTTTPWFVRTRRGYHAFYRWTEPTSNGSLRRSHGVALDIRADGGYVIGPGSVHSSGFRYRAIGNWNAPRTALPRFQRELFVRAPNPRPVLRSPRGDAETRAWTFISRYPCPPVGSGSDRATFQTACRLVRGFALDEDSALNLLRRWAPDFDEWWLTRKVQSAMTNGRDSMGGLL